MFAPSLFVDNLRHSFSAAPKKKLLRMCDRILNRLLFLYVPSCYLLPQSELVKAGLKTNRKKSFSRRRRWGKAEMRENVSLAASLFLTLLCFTSSLGFHFGCKHPSGFLLLFYMLLQLFYKHKQVHNSEKKLNFCPTLTYLG